ncbi:hypothetical protein Tco_0128216 [Tanacetum coccineum]
MIQWNPQAPIISVSKLTEAQIRKQDTPCNFKEEGIEHQTSTPRTPELNALSKDDTVLLLMAARYNTMLSLLTLFILIAEAHATHDILKHINHHPTREKTAYHIINGQETFIQHLHIFCCTCYLTKDGENLDKMKEKGDPCILVGYSTQSKGYLD